MVPKAIRAAARIEPGAELEVRLVGDAATAKKARAEKLWTWNRRQLSRFEDETLKVVTPAADTALESE